MHSTAKSEYTLQTVVAVRHAVLLKRIAHCCDQQTPDRRHFQRVRSENNQTVAAHLLQTWPGAGKMHAQIDTEARLQSRIIQLEIAQQALAGCAQQLFIEAAAQAANQRQLTDCQLALVLLHVTNVLHMQLADLAVGGQAKAEVVTGVTAEALAVVVQLAVLLGGGQLIIGQGELALADIAIAGRQQLLHRMAAHDPLVRLGGKAAGHQALQDAVATRRMGIVEDPHTAGL